MLVCYLCKNCGVIWRLILFFFMRSSLFHLFSVCFLLPVCSFWLKKNSYMNKNASGKRVLKLKSDISNLSSSIKMSHIFTGASKRLNKDLFSTITLKTLIWQLAECRWSVYSPFSVCLKVSTWILKGTPFSPPCLRGVNSVLMQCTWKKKHPSNKKNSQKHPRCEFYQHHVHFLRTSNKSPSLSWDPVALLKFSSFSSPCKWSQNYHTWGDKEEEETSVLTKPLQKAEFFIDFY